MWGTSWDGSTHWFFLMYILGGYGFHASWAVYMGVDAPVGSCVLSVHAYRCPVCRNGKCFCVSAADAGLVCSVVGMILDCEQVMLWAAALGFVEAAAVAGAALVLSAGAALVLSAAAALVLSAAAALVLSAAVALVLSAVVVVAVVFAVAAPRHHVYLPGSLHSAGWHHVLQIADLDFEAVAPHLLLMSLSSSGVHLLDLVSLRSHKHHTGSVLPVMLWGLAC